MKCQGLKMERPWLSASKARLWILPDCLRFFLAAYHMGLRLAVPSPTLVLKVLWGSSS